MFLFVLGWGWGGAKWNFMPLKPCWPRREHICLDPRFGLILAPKFILLLDVSVCMFLLRPFVSAPFAQRSFVLLKTDVKICPTWFRPCRHNVFCVLLPCSCIQWRCRHTFWHGEFQLAFSVFLCLFRRISTEICGQYRTVNISPRRCMVLVKTIVCAGDRRSMHGLTAWELLSRFFKQKFGVYTDLKNWCPFFRGKLIRSLNLSSFILESCVLTTYMHLAFCVCTERSGLLVFITCAQDAIQASGPFPQCLDNVFSRTKGTHTEAGRRIQNMHKTSTGKGDGFVKKGNKGFDKKALPELTSACVL